MPDTARCWLEGLAARGVAVTVRGNKLVLHPAVAYKDLTDAELLTLRHHRAEIKAVIASGQPIVPRVSAPPVSNVVSNNIEDTSPTPTPCRWCGRTCVGEKHPYFYDLHPVERQQRDDASATATMMNSIRRRNAQ